MISSVLLFAHARQQQTMHAMTLTTKRKIPTPIIVHNHHARVYTAQQSAQQLQQELDEVVQQPAQLQQLQRQFWIRQFEDMKIVLLFLIFLLIILQLLRLISLIQLPIYKISLKISNQNIKTCSIIMLKRLIPNIINRSSRGALLHSSFYYLSSRKIDPRTGIQLDEQKIKDKIKQIKQKTQEQSQEGFSTKKKVPQFMKAYKIKTIDPQIKKFRDSTQTNQIFAFEDYALQTKPTVLHISGYVKQAIQVNGMLYPPSLVITPYQVLVWEVRSAKDITLKHFDIARIIAPKPDHIVIGVQNIEDLDQRIKMELEKEFKIVNVNEMFQAVSLFNTQANDERNIMGFFIQE